MIEKGDTLELHIEGTRFVLRSKKIPESPTLKILGLAAGNKEPLEEAVVGEVERKLGREKIP
jgi:hypothetical protein